MQTLHAVHYLANQIFASDSLQKKPQGFKQTNIYEKRTKIVYALRVLLDSRT